MLTNYTCDDYGNIRKIERTVKSGEYSSLPNVQTYTYNSQNQLISYTIDEETYTISYDINGNPLAYAKPYTIIQRGSYKIGVIGVIGETLESSILIKRTP